MSDKSGFTAAAEKYNHEIPAVFSAKVSGYPHSKLTNTKLANVPIAELLPNDNDINVINDVADSLVRIR